MRFLFTQEALIFMFNFASHGSIALYFICNNTDLKVLIPQEFVLYIVQDILYRTDVRFKLSLT